MESNEILVSYKGDNMAEVSMNIGERIIVFDPDRYKNITEQVVETLAEYDIEVKLKSSIYIGK